MKWTGYLSIVFAGILCAIVTSLCMIPALALAAGPALLLYILFYSIAEVRFRILLREKLDSFAPEVSSVWSSFVYRPVVAIGCLLSIFAASVVIIMAGTVIEAPYSYVWFGIGCLPLIVAWSMDRYARDRILQEAMRIQKLDESAVQAHAQTLSGSKVRIGGFHDDPLGYSAPAEWWRKRLFYIASEAYHYRKALIQNTGTAWLGVMGPWGRHYERIWSQQVPKARTSSIASGLIADINDWLLIEYPFGSRHKDGDGLLVLSELPWNEGLPNRPANNVDGWRVSHAVCECGFVRKTDVKDFWGFLWNPPAGFVSGGHSPDKSCVYVAVREQGGMIDIEIRQRRPKLGMIVFVLFLSTICTMFALYGFAHFIGGTLPDMLEGAWRPMLFLQFSPVLLGVAWGLWRAWNSDLERPGNTYDRQRLLAEKLKVKINEILAGDF